MAQTRVGLSGWSYEDWRGDFYPDDLPRRRQLAYASQIFNSVEINGSFYSLLKPDTYRGWYEETPAGFLFAVKGSRFITHNKKLKDVETPLANFLASGVLALKDKLGPIVWQLSERFPYDRERLRAFLELLPHDTYEAARLARRHDSRLKAEPWTTADRRRRLRHALEVRHESYFVPELVQDLRQTGTALVFSDAADWPYTEELTAGYVYLRLHGAEQTYASRYEDSALDRFAERIRLWRRGKQPSDADTITDRKPPRRKSRDVYVYFDNDQHGHAPRDALRLARRLGLEVDLPASKD